MMEIDMNIHEPAHVQIAHLPTPLEPLPHLSEHFAGPELWIKRDDQTGLAFGGNKTRKLEYLVADALDHGARMLITRGARQSNHCRQTAAAAAKYGLECILVLTGEQASETGGNLLLDRILGAEIVWTEGNDPDSVLESSFERAEQAGRNPALIPYGGSNEIGACAYAFAMRELQMQGETFDRILFASSSGGTQAGMIAGAAMEGMPVRVTGISVDLDSESLRGRITPLLERIADLINLDLDPAAVEIDVNDNYLGGGYAVMGEPERAAIELFARLEGVLLDPVYTGRAAAGLIDLIQRGEIQPDERVLFWHTGGTPAIFAYGEELLSK
jgi:D-cysteine desulfhydrase family pyridoxal phosphate-dependent enzyme